MEIRIFDIKGAYVKTLLNAELHPGCHEISWKGADDHGKQMGSGVYLVMLSVQGYVQTQKITLIR